MHHSPRSHKSAGRTAFEPRRPFGVSAAIDQRILGRHEAIDHRCAGVGFARSVSKRASVRRQHAPELGRRSDESTTDWRGRGSRDARRGTCEADGRDESRGDARRVRRSPPCRTAMHASLESLQREHVQLRELGGSKRSRSMQRLPVGLSVRRVRGRASVGLQANDARRRAAGAARARGLNARLRGSTRPRGAARDQTRMASTRCVPRGRARTLERLRSRRGAGARTRRCRRRCRPSR